MNTIVWMYSGQGSQYYHMGAELYREDSIFRQMVDEQSAFAEPLTGVSIASLIYRHPGNRFDTFDRTLYTHPALFIVQFALDCTLRWRGYYPDYVLGYSLGEFVGYAVTGVMSWQNALSAVIRHAQILERAAAPGRMLAVLASLSEWEALRRGFPAVEVAAVNSPRHFVLTGGAADIEAIQHRLENRQIDCVLLPVRMAFHSSALDSLEHEFQALLAAVPVSQPRTPIVSSARAAILHSIRPELPWVVTRRSIQFQSAFHLLEARGPHAYIDLGPSGTLAGFVRQNLTPASSSMAVPILTPFGHDLANLRTAENRLSRPFTKSASYGA